jgi:RNA polymerase sigma factor (sigma-70 family)
VRPSQGFSVHRSHPLTVQRAGITSSTLTFSTGAGLSSHESTCWTVVQGAARGRTHDREEFARRYLPIIRAYLTARWQNSTHLGHLDDSVQEVFVECFRPNGVLARAESGRPFRPFLYGVVRNVARRAERGGQVKSDVEPDDLPGNEEPPDRAFDRAWARSILREAATVQEASAREAGPEALRRVELLRLRFHEGMPVRDIATLWGADPAELHRQCTKAREEFRAALTQVMTFHQPGTPAEVERACVEVLAMLG